MSLPFFSSFRVRRRSEMPLLSRKREEGHFPLFFFLSAPTRSRERDFSLGVFFSSVGSVAHATLFIAGKRR